MRLEVWLKGQTAQLRDAWKVILPMLVVGHMRSWVTAAVHVEVTWGSIHSTRMQNHTRSE